MKRVQSTIREPLISSRDTICSVPDTRDIERDLHSSFSKDLRDLSHRFSHRFDLPTVAVARVQSSSETPAPEPIVGHRGSRVPLRSSSMPTSLAPRYDNCTMSSELGNEIDAIISTREYLLDSPFRGCRRECTWYTRCKLSVRGSK